MLSSILVSQTFFASSGALGALIMFVADLILYFPVTNPQHRSAASYFSTIDPGGARLAHSSMQHVSLSRVMCGGALGPVSAVFYTIGFLGLYFGLQPEDPQESRYLLPAFAAIGHSLMMTIAAVYHALFAYTCFLSKLIAKLEKEGADSKSRDEPRALYNILELHRSYLRYVYKWAGVSGMIGSIAYIYCCLVWTTVYPWYSILLAPAMSAPIKKLLKKHNVGGVVLCGGLTNLWNLCFFIAIGHGEK